jgi:hypothetical protein
MAYPGNFAKLVASGNIYGVESFSFGMSIVPDFPNPDSFDAAGTIAAVAAAVSTFWSANPICSGARLEYIKLNEVDQDGHYVSNSETNLFEYPGTIPGNSSNRIAAQLAIAVSLTTAKRRGLAHAGRFYVPMPTSELETDGRFNGNAAQTFADTASAMVNTINGVYGGDYVVGVASKEGAGAFEPVTGVRVGRVLDTIRSRRASLDENSYLVGAAIT